MSEHTAIVQWNRRDRATFTDNQYSREHTWTFDGGVEVPASSSPHVVPVPYSNPTCVDPEEAFVASLSSCHMLWFLSIAAKQKFVVERYTDQAIGVMDKNQDRQLAMVKVLLRPQVTFVGDRQPTEQHLQEMHEEAHHRCFLANSVKTAVIVEAIAP
ncbi:MAG: OsmC family protein [Oscillatoriales cyanobacterium C42_A2020_001]|nr:OsmC family protein [Leptolyngbyaceae cyanobacterium C42_A2020_001]